MNWLAAKWLLAAESTVPKTGNCSASPLPDADTLKKKVIFKKDFWLNFTVFRIRWRVWKGQNLLLFWSWYPRPSCCCKFITGFWESCTTPVTRRSSPGYGTGLGKTQALEELLSLQVLQTVSSYEATPQQSATLPCAQNSSRLSFLKVGW